MPGPKATNRTHRAPAPNSPNKKTRARLKARVDTYGGGESAVWEHRPPSGGGMMTFHRPGSENRSK